MEIAVCSLLHYEIDRFGAYERTPWRFLMKRRASELPTQAQRVVDSYGLPL